MAFPFHPPTGSRDSALSKGVGMKVELRYGAFDQDMNTKHGYVNFRDVMAGSYGDTYWFYLMFKK